MFGANYKFQTNESKQIITLRPTLGTVVTLVVVPMLMCVAPLFVIGFLDGWKEKKAPLKNTSEEL